MSAYLEKQKLLDWIGNLEYDVDAPYWKITDDIIDAIEAGLFDWQPND